MILGIGTDIVENKRFAKWIKTPNMLSRYFTPAEIELCFSKPNPQESFAVRFAGKEALLKATGAGFSLPLKEIEILTEKDGRAFIQTEGKVKSFLKSMGVSKVHISLSHEVNYSVANILLEASLDKLD